MATATPEQPRDGRGQYARDTATAERDAEICRMRAGGLSLRAIGQRLDMHHSSVAEALERSFREIVAEPAADARALELARLDAELDRLNDYETAARAVLEHDHITVNNGRVIMHDGDPVPDTAPVLAAIDRLVRIEDARRRNAERRAKLLGLDMPVKVDAQVTEVTQQDIELQEMVTEIRARNAVIEQRLRAGREAGGD